MKTILNKKYILFVLGLLIAIFGFGFKAFAGGITVTTYPASSITTNKMTLNGYYTNTTTGTITVRFDYGLTPNMGTLSPVQVFQANTSGNFSFDLVTVPNTKYFFRAAAFANGQLPAFGGDLNATSLVVSFPDITTYPASDITQTEAKLNGYFDSKGNPTSVYFEYANNSSFIGSTKTTQVLQSNVSGNFSQIISGLTANKKYYFRAIAVNQAGTKISTLVLNFQTKNIVQTIYACSDGLDNDSDNLIDYPSDPGCTSSTDNNEYNSIQTIYACSDGLDNDYDGYIDSYDPGCTSSTDNDEYHTVNNNNGNNNYYYNSYYTNQNTNPNPNIVYVGGNTYEPQQQYIYTGGGTTTIIKDQDTVYEGGRASFDHDIMGNNYLNSLSWNGRNVYYNNDGIKNTNIKERKVIDLRNIFPVFPSIVIGHINKSTWSFIIFIILVLLALYFIFFHKKSGNKVVVIKETDNKKITLDDLLDGTDKDSNPPSNLPR